MQLELAHHGAELTLEDLAKNYGGRPVVAELNLTVAPHEFVTILGPSGSGKTTALRMIGGFVRPDSGRILIDRTDVAGVPVEHRPTAMLFQQLSLWPHLSVARNVSFGLEIRRRPKAEISRRVGELLEIVGLSDFGSRLPGQLSGGEQQRVALARALALEPRILLLDEPFSALDAGLRRELRTFVRNLQREVGTTALLVTHDQEEALELSDRIVVMRRGRVEQIGVPSDCYDAPRTAFVAEFLGTMNFCEGEITHSGVALLDGTVVPIVGAPARLVGHGRIGVRPEDVLIGAEGDRAATFVVESVTPRGHYQQLTMRAQGGRLLAYVAKEVAARPGDLLPVRFGRVHLFLEDAAETPVARRPRGRIGSGAVLAAHGVAER